LKRALLKQKKTKRKHKEKRQKKQIPFSLKRGLIKENLKQAGNRKGS
jgi:hypothetical protein